MKRQSWNLHCVVYGNGVGRVGLSSGIVLLDRIRHFLRRTVDTNWYTNVYKRLGAVCKRAYRKPTMKMMRTCLSKTTSQMLIVRLKD